MYSAHQVGKTLVKSNLKLWLRTPAYIVSLTKNNTFTEKGYDEGKKF